MKQARAYIFTEGGRNIGYGHITRCSSLYEALKAKGVKPRFIIKGNNVSRAALKGKDFRLIDWIGNPGIIGRLVGPDTAVIVDSYLAPKRVYETISAKTRRCAFIDDNIRIAYPRGIVVNGTIGAENFKYPRTKGVRYLLGTRYMPLRKDFWKNASAVVRNDIRNALFTFGGDDPRGITPRVLAAFKPVFPDLTKHVVIGNGFRQSNIKAVLKLAGNRTRIYKGLSSGGMKKLMAKCDAAFSAGGQTLYELARMGLPVVCVKAADNQVKNIRGWLKLGFIEYAGSWDSKEMPRNTVAAMKSIKSPRVRAAMSRNGRKAVDGKGSSRVVEALIS